MKICSHSFRGLLMAASIMLAASCGGRAVVSGVLENCPSSELTVRLLNMNRYETLDTLTTGKDGSFRYKMDIEEGQPEFVYFFHNGVKVASAILVAGDRIDIAADTLGNYSVDGSEETERLADVEKKLAEVFKNMSNISAAMEARTPGSEEYESLRHDLADEYISYYRDRVQYLLSNSKSLTAIPVLYQMIGDMPLFAQQTDAIHFSRVADSLETVYPASRYVKALRKEAQKRLNLMQMNNLIQNAPTRGFPEIELPDINATKRKLSEVEGKVVLLHFWAASEANNNMVNLDVLKPLYEKYHSKGLEIYQVALNVDKAMWATVVKNQKLEWINVCDNSGSQSRIANLWKVQTLPTTFIISDGAVVNGNMTTPEDLEKSIASLLK